MAQNDLKANHSSSSEDEEEDEPASSSDSDEVSDTDSGEKPKQESKTAVTVPPVSSSTESEESGSDSDTDSDSPPKKLAGVSTNSKPVSSSVVERAGTIDSKLVKKDGSKTVPAPPPSKSKRPPPGPTEIEKDAKKAKQNAPNGKRTKVLVSSSQSANKAQAPDLSASETEESGSDSDTDSNPPPKRSAVAGPNVISSKPMERESPNLESKTARKSGSKTVSTPPPSKSKPPAAAKNGKDAKKGKKSTATDDDSKKQLFQRLWSEDDEIVILQGMIDYKNEKNGEDPVANIPAFHDFTKKSLHVDVSTTQVLDKIRRLRRKYVNNAGREKDGKDRSFSKSHEQKCYELSKLIWGSSERESKKNASQKNGKLESTVTGTAASVLKSNGVDDKDKITMDVEKKLDASRFVQYGARIDSPIMSEEMVKVGLELVDSSKRAELEAKWMKLKEEEIVLYVKRMELLKEQALVVLEAVRSAGN